MAEAIGPGTWLERVRVAPDHCPQMRPGSVWCVSDVQDTTAPCLICGGKVGAVFSNDPAPPYSIRLPHGPWGVGWCPCGFRPYQGPEQASVLTCEPIEREGLPA
jgi:hypothetical protein